MKKMNKKGFTIVELVIVIAVIAILAAVMIPTFGGIIKRANESAAMQEATATYKALLTEEEYNGNLDLQATGADLYIVIDAKYVFSVTNGTLKLENDTNTVNTDYTGHPTATGYTNVWLKPAAQAGNQGE